MFSVRKIDVNFHGCTMRIKQRIEQLEGLSGNRRGAIVAVHVQDGRITDGEFSGMSVKQVEKKLSANDTLIMVTRSSVPAKNPVIM